MDNEWEKVYLTLPTRFDWNWRIGFKDRGYTHINFTTTIPELASDVEIMLQRVGYVYSVQCIQEKKPNVKLKYVIRIAKRSKEFIEELGIDKS
jgi:hypothetical protein